MSARRTDTDYLADMLGRARLIVQLATSMSSDQLDPADDRTAIERWLTIVGEAAKNVSDSFKSAHPEIEWKKIIRSRNILSHVYDDVDYEIIWRICEAHLPELIRQLEPLVSPAPPDPEFD